MFVPLYDGVPLRYLRYPLANWSIIAVNAFMFLWLQSAPDTGRVRDGARSYSGCSFRNRGAFA